MTDDGQRLEQVQAKITALETNRLRDAVRQEAASHGMIDASDLDNIPLDGVTIGPNGTINGVKAFVEGFKNSKPHWFSRKPAATATASTRIPTSSEILKASNVQPGSPEAKQLEQDFLRRYSR